MVFLLSRHEIVVSHCWVVNIRYYNWLHRVRRKSLTERLRRKGSDDARSYQKRFVYTKGDHAKGLHEFFEELHNCCFPVNCPMKQELKLKRYFRNDKKLSAYVHELGELYNTVGAVEECKKIISKLWYGPLRDVYSTGTLARPAKP